MKDYSEFEEASPFGPSNNSGVYGVFITTKIKTRCVYIGSSQNIQKRVNRDQHLYRKIYDKFSNYETHVYTRQIICNDYSLKEKELIRKYKPLLNKMRYGA